MKSLLIVLGLLASLTGLSQEQPQLSDRRNTIKLDLTSFGLYRQAWVVCYERVISNKHSWGVIGGFQRLPESSRFGGNIAVTRDTRATGLKVGAEYRFYLAKENKYAPPHGVYIGPYFSLNNFSNGRTIEVNNNGVIEPAELSADINVLNLGVQLGYQFVFNDRWTVDLSFMGPSFSNYRAKFDLSGNYTFDPDQITNEIIKDLVGRFPGLNDLLTNGSVSNQGKVDTWAFGYRYQIMVGYHFGHKRK